MFGEHSDLISLSVLGPGGCRDTKAWRKCRMSTELTIWVLRLVETAFHLFDSVLL